MVKKVDIRPSVSVLAALQHLNYKPWYALGEFVDNAVQSSINCQSELQAVHKDNFKLRVDIDIDGKRISIRDNAAGIRESDYGRAFRPAAIPPDRMGLAEFGMGMKSAACWFAPRWSVRTSALGEAVEREINFDIENIVEDNIEELKIQERKEEPDQHYTEIILQDVFHLPVGRTINKLKEHLGDIYREFIREGTLELRLDGNPLAYQEPKILKAPYYRDKDDQTLQDWRKSIEFDFGEGLSVHGFAALRDKASTAKAGFALFRRGRVIQGSGDEGYRPAYIFGRSNSYRYQRLFGELHLEGFEVSHTKDGFRWDDNEQPFLEFLREHLDKPPLRLLDQAEGYRARVGRSQLKKNSEKALKNTTGVLKDRLPSVALEIIKNKLVETTKEAASHTSTLSQREFDLEIEGEKWRIIVEFTDDAAEEQWLELTDRSPQAQDPRILNIRISIVHPFMERYAQNNPEAQEALLRVAIAIALSEVLAQDSGVRFAGTVKSFINQILRHVFSDA